MNVQPALHKNPYPVFSSDIHPIFLLLVCLVWGLVSRERGNKFRWRRPCMASFGSYILIRRRTSSAGDWNKPLSKSVQSTLFWSDLGNRWLVVLRNVP